MQRHEEIEKCIETQDIKKLRNIVGSLIYASRDFSNGEFDEVVQYVESKGIKLKEDFLVGDPPISSIKDVYTNDDFSRAVFELKNNFCDERIKDVKTIGRALYGKKAEKAPEKSKPENAPGGASSGGGANSGKTDRERPKVEVRPKAPSQSSTALIGILAVALLAILLIILLVKLLK